MLIRPAVLTDGAAIGKVQLSSWRTMFPDAGVNAENYLAEFSFEERAEDWEEFLAALPDNRLVYVATNPLDEVVGFAVGQQETGTDALYASELGVVHLLPAYRNQGIGRQLIGTVAQQLSQRGCGSLWLWTLKGNPARRFYERLGGKVVGEETKTLGKNEVTIEITEVSYGWPDIDQLIQACK